MNIPSKEWVEVIDWMEKNTEKNAVFALCWNHGNRILALTERATIADNEQMPYQVYLQARHIFLAQSEKEALEFLFTHKATHLLISSADIDIINTISRIGANKQFDRQTSIHYLRGDKSGLHFSPDSNDNLSVKSVDLYLDSDGNPTSAVITVNDKQIKLKPKLASVTRQKYVFSDDNLKGCIIFTPMEVVDCGCESENEQKKSWNAIYLDEIAKNSLAVKLYLLEENNPYFVSVYPSKSNIPQDNSIKIWEINYPDGIKENPDYLLIKPPNPGR